MKPVYQTILRGPMSNCLQAAVASIFELKLDAVPNFSEFYDSDDWVKKYSGFCLQYGVYPITLGMVSAEGDKINLMLYGYHIISGFSVRGVRHACVGLNGKIVHDPFPGGSGLEKIENYDIFVSVMSSKARKASKPLPEVEHV